MYVRQHTIAFALAATTLLIAAGCSQGTTQGAVAEYDEKSGRLRRVTFDRTQDGRPDTVGVMDGARVEHVELDLDEDGRTDRWDFYRAGNTLDRVGFSRLRDGVLDAEAFYAPDGSVSRIELSSARNGKVDRIEFYENGVLVRAEVDGNGDSRPDRWETYRPNPGAAPGEPAFALASVAFDDDGRGTPQRTLVYGPDGRVTAQLASAPQAAATH